MSAANTASILAELARLTTSLFSADELRRLFGFWPEDRPLAAELALDGSPAALADAAVQYMDRRGLIDDFLARIRADRGRRTAEIDAIARRWRAAHDGEVVDDLPLSHALQRVQQIAESDDVVAHRQTTSLHLLYALVMVAPPVKTRGSLVKEVRPDRLLRALHKLVEKERAAVAPAERTTTEGYERLWKEARLLARRQQAPVVDCTHMFECICALQPTTIGEYLESLPSMSWRRFKAHASGEVVRRGVGQSKGVDLTHSKDEQGPSGPPPPHAGPRPESQDPRLRDEDAYHWEVFQDFVNRKLARGQDVAMLSFSTFAERLRATAATKMTEPDACAVQFEVYERDGKVGLRVHVVRTGAPRSTRAQRSGGPKVPPKLREDA
jgi:hypothetical protein